MLVRFSACRSSVLEPVKGPRFKRRKTCRRDSMKRDIDDEATIHLQDVVSVSSSPLLAVLLQWGIVRLITSLFDTRTKLTSSNTSLCSQAQSRDFLLAISSEIEYFV